MKRFQLFLFSSKIKNVKKVQLREGFDLNTSLIVGIGLLAMLAYLTSLCFTD